MEQEMVNHPAHYNAGGIECIEAIRAALSPEEFKGFLKGTAIRYLWRGGKKFNESEDYKKCAWYVDKLTEKHVDM